MIHELKTWKEYFVAVFRADKTFELRKNDRDFCVGHELLLKEYDNEKQEYTGRILHRRISYIIRGEQGKQFGLQEGFCIMGLQTI